MLKTTRVKAMVAQLLVTQWPTYKKSLKGMHAILQAPWATWQNLAPLPIAAQTGIERPKVKIAGTTPMAAPTAPPVRNPAPAPAVPTTTAPPAAEAVVTCTVLLDATITTFSLATPAAPTALSLATPAALLAFSFILDATVTAPSLATPAALFALLLMKTALETAQPLIAAKKPKVLPMALTTSGVAVALTLLVNAQSFSPILHSKPS